MAKHMVLVSDPVEMEGLKLGDDFQIDFMPKITRRSSFRR